jgi:hypothetical protein
VLLGAVTLAAAAPAAAFRRADHRHHTTTKLPAVLFPAESAQSILIHSF